MDRVDVVVVGGGLSGLVAAREAASSGVRALIVDAAILPNAPRHSVGLTETELSMVGIAAGSDDQIHREILVNQSLRGALDGNLTLHVVKADAVHLSLLERARASGVELKTHVRITEIVAEDDGWMIRCDDMEPLRASLILVADGARSSTLARIGVQAAQRFSRHGHDILTFIVGSWVLPPSELVRYPSYEIRHRARALERLEILPGKDDVTVAFGPVWYPRPPRLRDARASDDEAGIRTALSYASRWAGLSPTPHTLAMIECCVDALPSPPVFDGGIVVASAAGHRLPRPLVGWVTQLEAARCAGLAAASAILRHDTSARRLKQMFDAAYEECFAAVVAEASYQAHGLYGRKRARIGASDASFRSSKSPTAQR